MAFGKLGAMGRGFGTLGALGTVVYDPDAQAYFNAVVAAGGAAFSAADKALWNTAIKGWKAAGTWALRDCIQIYAGPSSVAGRINIKNPANFTASFVNSPTFTAYRGVTTDGASSYVSTAWAPNAVGNSASVNSINVALGTTTEGALANRDLGAVTPAGGGLFVILRYTANQIISRVNDGTNGTAANAIALGEGSANRSASNARQYFQSGAQIGSDTTASTSISTAVVSIGRDGANYTSRQYTHFMGGASLTAQQKSDEWAVTYALLRGVGALA